MLEELQGSRWAAIQYVFLDRDGVINRKLPEGKFVTRWDEFELLPGVAEAIAELNRSRRSVIVVTNQRGVALGLMSEAELQSIHDRMRAELVREGASLDAVYYCPHERGVCDCRKPGTGMVESAFRDFPGAGAANSVLIGDSLADMECGRRAGMATIFVDDEMGQAESRGPDAEAAKRIADAVVPSLAAARLLLG